MTNKFIDSTIETTDMDFGERQLASLFHYIDKNSPHVDVGFMGEKTYIKQEGGGGTEVPPSIVDVAVFNEFGTHAQVTDAMRGWFKGQGVKLAPETTEIVSPERPFIRQAVDQNRDKIIDFIDSQLEDVLSFEIDTPTALKRIGQFVKNLIQQQFTKGDFAPLSDFTVNRKGSTKPLLNTGRLRQSVAYRVNL